MYLIKKKIMYWRVPETTRIKSKISPSDCYCFIPAKLVRKESVDLVDHFSQQYHTNSVAKTIRDRSVSLSQ